jgi:alkylhydroperoxidase/carboxymuconolactone decarboxylase family protein YurZ
MLFRIGMSYEDTVKDIQQTFGMFPGFFKNTPKDVLPQMWPLFKKYQIGESIIPKKYREMMMLASAAATKCPYCQTYHRSRMIPVPIRKKNGKSKIDITRL